MPVVLWPVVGLIGFEASLWAIEQPLRQRRGSAIGRFGHLRQIQAILAGMPTDAQGAVSGCRSQTLALWRRRSLDQLGRQGNLFQQPDFTQRRVNPNARQLSKQRDECQRSQHRDNGGQGNPAGDGVARRRRQHESSPSLNRSPGREQVTDIAHGANHLDPFAVELQLAPQTADLYVDAAIERVMASATSRISNSSRVRMRWGCSTNTNSKSNSPADKGIIT